MNATHWISIAQVVATAFVGIVAGVITYIMQNKQIDIAKGLQETARGQHETAATKLRLELFEKRYEAYENVLSHLHAALKHDVNDVDFNNDKALEEYSLSYAPIKFLFNSYIHSYLKDDVTERIKDFFDAVHDYQYTGKRDVEPQTLRDQYTSSYAALIKVFRILDAMVSPYLQVEKEDLLINQKG